MVETATVVRICLLIVAVLLLIWFFWWRSTKKYKYSGLKKYNSKGTLVKDFIDFFVKQVKPKKKRENKRENMCRKIIEKIYKANFPSIRPDFLQSPKTGKNLELDCYNSDLNIALEYNGIQHYKYNKYFHKSKKDFYSQVHRDDWKRKRCRELGIRLIEIPYWVEPNDMKEYIILQLRKKDCL